MRILIPTNFHPFEHVGGIETVVKNLSTRLVKRGHEVTIICGGEDDKSGFYEGVKVVQCQMIARIASAVITLNAYKRIEEEGKSCDVIFIQEPNPWLSALSALYAHSTKKKLVVLYHSDMHKFNPITKTAVFGYKKFIQVPLLFNKAKKLYATSNEYIKTSTALQVRQDVDILKLGVDPTKYIVDDNYQPQRKLLFVGRFVDYKGTQYLIEAMPHIDAKLTIIGTGKNEETLHKLARKLKLDYKITWTRAVSNYDLKKAYTEHDMLILPSVMRSEAFGLVLLEMMANHKPVIATSAIPGAVDLLKDSDGLLVEPKNPKAIAKIVNRLLDSKEEYDKARAWCANRVKEYDWDLIVEKLDKDLRGI